jgi:hypothetical protein
MEIVKVSVRRCKETGCVEMFYWNKNSRSVWLESFSWYDGANEASLGYYRNATYQAADDDAIAHAKRLEQHWNSLPGESCKVMAVKRLLRS